MEIRSDVLYRALKAVLYAASKDTERPQLCAVQIWTEHDRVSLGATDGHWALWWQDVLDADLPTERVGIPRVDAELLLHALHALAPADTESDWPNVTFTLDPPQVECDKFTIRLDAVGLTPQLTEIWRLRESGNIPWVGVTAAFITAASNAFRAAAGLRANMRVSLSFGPTELDPILVSCEACEQLTAIIMPAKETPTEVREEVHGDERRWIRKDTGEVVRTAPVPKQTPIPGTADPLGEAMADMQAVADSIGGAISVEFAGQKITLASARKPKRAPKTTAVED